MVSNNFGVTSYRYNISFGKNNEKSKFNYADSFIAEFKKQEINSTNGTWLKRNMGTVTSSAPVWLAFFYELYALLKMGKLRNELPKEALKKLKNKYTRNILLFFGTSFIATLGINKYLNSKTDTNYNKLKQKYGEINTQTDAVLADKMLYSDYIGALYDPTSGTIQLNKNIVNDPIMGRNIDKIIKHELVHAKQYEIVARSQDGIKKVNYATMKNIADNIKKKAIFRDVYNNIYNDITNNSEKYKNTRIRLNSGGIEVNFKDYITALYTLINNPNAGMNDIPMVINAQHYQKVIDEKGPLSPEEEEKADKYYEAMLAYPRINFLHALNPFSSYRKNLLEQEAYKENPPFYKRIFCKKDS